MTLPRSVLAALATALAAAACYRPSLARCELQCSGTVCPSGLACNAQGYCADSVDDVCATLPTDATPPSGLVTVTVHDPFGLPVPGAKVVFVGPDDDLIAEVATDPNGDAQLVVPAGSSATVRHSPQGTLEPISTFVDLWPGAHVVSRPFLATALSPYMISWPPLANATSYEVRASCMKDPEIVTGTTTTIFVPSRCAEFDVVVIGRSGDGDRAVVAPRVSGNHTITQPWGGLDTLTYQATGFPTNTQNGSGSATLLAWASRDLPDVTMLASEPNIAAPITEFVVPASAGSTLSFAFAPAGIAPLSVFQFEMHRLPPTMRMFQRDFAGQLLPWPILIEVDLSPPGLRWQTVDPNSGVAAPDLIATAVTYMRGGTTYYWRVIAPATRIGGTQTMRELRLPSIPGTYAFEPLASDVVKDAAVSLIRVTAGTASAVYEIIEDGGVPDYDLFGIAALDRLTVSGGIATFP